MLYNKLFAWQKTLIDKFKHKQNFGLFLDMGLGKTVVSLAFAEVNNCSKTIVITLNSKALETEQTSGSWHYWAKQSNMQYDILSKYSSESQFKENKSQIFITNYESLFSRNKNKKEAVTLSDKLIAFIKSCKNNNVAIIIDESHKMKNLSSVQTKAIMKLQKHLNIVANNVYCYLLTGTPFSTGYIDLYSQLKFLGLSMTKGEFKDKFCIMGNIPGLLGWQQPIAGYKNIDKLFALLHQYAITILSDEVEDLPDTIVVNHTLSVSREFNLFVNEQMKGSDILYEIYNRNIDNHEDVDVNLYQSHIKTLVNNPFYRNFDFPSLNWLAETTGTFWLRARQLSIGFQGNASLATWYDRRRLDALEEFLKNNEDNYVLFYNFTPELVEIYDIAERLGYKIDVFCGEVKSLYFYNQYAAMTNEQKFNSKKRIIIANFASGSTGMNWQEYNKCILFSLPVYRDYAQAIKRVHRYGQKKTVFYHIFTQLNWLDISMKKSLDEQIDYTLDMFESDSSRVKAIINSNEQ